MKPAVAITLIIMGALMIMSPIVADFLYQRNVVEVLRQTSDSNVSLVGQMSDEYRFGCWVTGTGMIAIAVLASLKNSPR